jgi:hypothetical protein
LGGTDYSGFNQFADRPNVGTGKLTQHNKSSDGAFNTSYFSTITAGQVGTERRDLTAAKDFPLSERFKLKLLESDRHLLKLELRQDHLDGR